MSKEEEKELRYMYNNFGYIPEWVMDRNLDFYIEFATGRISSEEMWQLWED